MDFVIAGGIEMIVDSRSPNGVLFEGSKGRMFVNRGRISGKPVEALEDDPLPEGADAAFLSHVIHSSDEQQVVETILHALSESSPMADAAKALPANHGRAEEIYLMAPDLVLTGQFSAGPAVQMLQDLGISRCR